MKILVSEQNVGNPRISTFRDKEEQLEKIKFFLKVPYYVYEVDDEIPRDRLNEILNQLRGLDVKDILVAEAAKFCKKKYDKKFEAILNNIVAVG